jgi:LuxR family maltose regulon positive regulatory protein
VLTTKLLPPRARASAVLRARLLEQLRLALEVPLTLVVAPAGWGKTTLVGDWLRRDGLGAGWLSLDALDDDPKRFWRYLLLAAAGSGPGVGHAALRRLDAAGSDVVRDVVPTFVNEVVSAQGHVVVVLDDFHCVRARTVVQSVALLVERCPENLHVVLVARSDPPLPLSRLRVRDELVEIRSDRLRFTRAEAGVLLNDRLGLGLAEPEIDRLVARTEGWAAGLQLAALRLRDVPDRAAFIDAFTGATKQVVDYLGEEVLDAQPAKVREFLLATCVLDRFCAALCDAVTQEAASAAMLSWLVRTNLFVISLDEKQRWFRYHHLFAELLRHELADRGNDQASRLLSRAAYWHSANGAPSEAIEYALRAGAVDLACDLVAEHWRSHFNAGQWETVQRWLAALPPERVAIQPSLSVGSVWIALDNGLVDAARLALDAAEAAGAADEHLRVLRVLILYKQGDLGGAAARLALVGRERQAGSLDRDAAFTRTVAWLVRGVVALWSGRTGEAEEHLTKASAGARADGNRLALIYASGCRALAAVARDDAWTAEQHVQLAEATVRDSLSDAHFVAMFPALARARLALREGQWAQALVHARRAAELARRGAARGELAAALLTAAAAQRRSGLDTVPGADNPLSWLAQAGEVLSECPDPGPLVGSWLAAEQRAANGRPGSRGSADNPPDPLTDRELAVLRLLPTAAPQRELAATLFVSPNTLKTHLKALYRKLGVDSRAGAVLRARQQGLI